MAWVFIDVPSSEVQLALQAGAELHRRHATYFYDNRKHDAGKFARWTNIPDPTGAKPEVESRQAGSGIALLSLHEVAVLCMISARLLRALVDEGLFPKPVESAGKTSRGDKWSVSQVEAWRADSPLGAAFTTPAGPANTSFNFVGLSDIAGEAGYPSRREAFAALRAAGVLMSSDIPSLHNAPTEEFLKRGWFVRLERYLPSKSEIVFQTVVVAPYAKDVVAYLRAIMPATDR